MSDQPLLTWTEAKTVPAEDEISSVIGRCLSGDQHAYIELYELHGGMIYRLAFSLLQDTQDAEEVLQDSFEYAFRRLAHFDPRKSAFKTWLYRIAISRCRNKRRRKWLPSFSLTQFEDREPRDPTTPQPEERAEMSEQQRAVWQAVGELSPKLREVAILRYYGGLQYGEIGQVLDIPTKTAESRMRLAHKALRERLAALIEPES